MDAAADCPPRAAAGAAGSSGGADSQTTFPAMTSSANTTTVVPGTKTKGKEKKGKKATAPEETHRCFHCQSDGARMCCSQCHRAWYCGRPCQKKHWKQHKKACVAAVAAEARRAKLRRKATAARGGDGIDKETCVICVGPVVAPVELPCGHAYCGGCLNEQRRKGVTQRCPLCREDLPPTTKVLSQLAMVSGLEESSPLRYDFERLPTILYLKLYFSLLVVGPASCRLLHRAPSKHNTQQ